MSMMVVCVCVSVGGWGCKFIIGKRLVRMDSVFMRSYVSLVCVCGGGGGVCVGGCVGVKTAEENSN